MQPRNHARRFEGILKMKSQAFKAPDPESLQSKFPFARKIESPIKALRVLRGRLDSRWKMSNPFWLRVPPNRIIDRIDNPTNRGVVCFTPEAGILCFVRPAES